MNELKPCPFCGSKAELYSDGYSTYASCANQDCGASIEVDDLNSLRPDRAVAVWNHRDNEVAELKEAAK